MRTGGFSDAIGLASWWPHEPNSVEEISVRGLVAWADEFYRAAERLHLMPEARVGTSFYAGPVIHTIGLAAELSLKAMLRGAGASRSELREVGHNTYGAYLKARKAFDEVEFLKLYFSNIAHRAVPKQIADRLAKEGEMDPDTRWRFFFDHLRVLDLTYDRPFRSRYVVAGEIVLPDSELLLIGTKILLSAMKE